MTLPLLKVDPENQSLQFTGLLPMSQLAYPEPVFRAAAVHRAPRPSLQDTGPTISLIRLLVNAEGQVLLSLTLWHSLQRADSPQNM